MSRSVILEKQQPSESSSNNWLIWFFVRVGVAVGIAVTAVVVFAHSVGVKNVIAASRSYRRMDSYKLCSFFVTCWYSRQHF